ncbi:MAG: alanine racemase [Alphaproteobacteria bacterium]|nr:alanine racemase [Alphaproteobacteria bacterium]
MSGSDFEAARLTVRLGAVNANFRACRHMCGPAAVAGVVKAEAYGMGMIPVARSLAAIGCDTFFVARLEEGVKLRPEVPEARIFVLDGAQPDAVPALVGHRLTPVLNSLAEVAAWSAAARTLRTDLDAAVHIDTGMNRLGLPGAELAVLAAESKTRLAGLRVVLWMSHLACAEDPQARMNRIQLDRFHTALAMLPAAPASFASSAGIMLGKDYAFDMVRPGVGLYGGNPQPSRPNPFATVAVLTGRILQMRHIEPGESAGYGATFRPTRPSVLATCGLGYTDGLMRALAGRGFGAIDGKRVPVAGRVSMDLITLDVTDAPSAKVGGDVEFIGDHIALEEIAAASGTASYEILTSLARRVPRHYEGAP